MKKLKLEKDLLGTEKGKMEVSPTFLFFFAKPDDDDDDFISNYFRLN